MTERDSEPASQEGLKSNLLINPNKAGTQTADPERVKEIIFEASRVHRESNDSRALPFFSMNNAKIRK